MSNEMKAETLVPVEHIEKSILLIRGQKVMLDRDLAELYGVETKNLNLAVRRNLRRFPEDFMFQHTAEEYGALRLQIETLKRGRGRHRKYLPHAFTEQSVAMLSSVLHSERAIQVNLAIMRAFVRLREMLASNRELARRLDELDQKYDARFRAAFEAIRQLMAPSTNPPKRRIGFRQDENAKDRNSS
jgi:hypothetical protein